MTQNITSTQWRGDWATPIDAHATQFTAIEAPQPGECTGCMFRTQRSAVCDQALAIASNLGLPGCTPYAGPTFIYVADRKTDPRQMRVTQEVNHAR